LETISSMVLLHSACNGGNTDYRVCAPETSVNTNVGLTTTGDTFLNWWTLYCSIRTEDTAIASCRFQNSMTVFTIVKILTCISRHRLFFFVATVWARYG
jgi:hypothetical protein